MKKLLKYMVHHILLIACLISLPSCASPQPVQFSVTPFMSSTVFALEEPTTTVIPNTPTPVPTALKTLTATTGEPSEVSIDETPTVRALPSVDETLTEPIPSGWLAYIGYPLGFEIVRTSGSGWRMVVDLPYPEIPVWSPDGQWIALGNGGELYLARPDGSELERLTYAPGYKGCVSWSPDGESIAYSQVIDGTTEPAKIDIYLMTLNPRRIRQITSTQDYYEHCPAFSPQGDKIAYTAVDYRNDHWYLKVMHIDGTDPKEIYDSLNYISGPKWGPNGNQIVFSSGREDCDDLYVINRDGRGLRQITDMPGYEGAPSWSPDGNWIVFEAADICGSGASGQSFFIVHPDGNGLVKLPLNLPTPLHSPSWAPLPALEAGKTFEVTESGAGLKVRSSSSITAEILDILEQGDEIFVLGEPTEADGYPWWQVEVSSSGKKGWVAEIPGWFSRGGVN